MNLQLRKEQIDYNELSQEALEILEILDQIENHTAILRKKLVSELKSKNEVVHLKAEKI